MKGATTWVLLIILSLAVGAVPLSVAGETRSMAPADPSVPADWWIGQAELQPALDGDLSEWGGVPALVLDLSQAATISGATPSRADAMATLQMAWTPDGLFLAVHVRDDLLIYDSGSDLAQDDTFQFAVDGNRDGAGGGPGDHVYRVRADGQQSDKGVVISALTVRTRTVPTGYNLEIRIPASHLNIGPLLPNVEFGFNWALADDDNGGQADTTLIWRGTRIDPPEAGWPVAALDAGQLRFTGLLEAGRWEWAGDGTLNDVFALDAARAWAVGNGVWKTEDGGATWEHLKVFAGNTLQRVHFADTYRGWAVGDAGRILRTEDGGASGTSPAGDWQPAYTESPRPDLLPLRLLTVTGTDDVWAGGTRSGWSHGDGTYGEQGIVLHSTDGGASWQRRVLIYGPLQGLSFFDQAHGWVIGRSTYAASGACPAGHPGDLLRATTDAGATWSTVCLGDATTAWTLTDIAFGSATHGWLIGSRGGATPAAGVIWRSTDAGATWSEQRTGSQPFSWVQAQDDQRAWVGQGTTILRTTDGGATWTQLAGAAPTRARFRTESEGWGVSGGTIYKTTNGGASWSTLYTLPTGSAPWFWDHLTGWRAAGANIERTTDGGGTWQSAATGLSAVDRFQFVDPLHGWAWHNATSGLARTTNGGVTWAGQMTGSDALNDLQFVDASHGWVRSTTNQLRRTTDGGVTWPLVAPVPTPPPGTNPRHQPIVNGVRFLDANRGWGLGTACTDGITGTCQGYQAQTSNGGSSWGSTYAGPGRGMAFLDASKGWGLDWELAGYQDAWFREISRTTNGGSNWTSLWRQAGNQADTWFGGLTLADLFVADLERVWVSGAALSGPNDPLGPVIFSSNGGSTWSVQRAESSSLGPRLGFDRTASAFAFGNALLRYRNTEVVAYRAAQPPTINGNLDEWAGVPAYSLTVDRAGRVQKTPPAPLDASAILQASWDGSHLYFALRVYDDAIVVDNATTTSPWKDDVIELGIDGDHDHRRRADADYGDRQFSLNANGDQFESGRPTSGLTVGRALTADGYILEVAIPQANLGPTVPAAGKIIGFNWSQQDDDDGGDTESRLVWLGMDTYSAEAAWGQLRLSNLTSTTVGETPTPTPTGVGASPTPTMTPTGVGASPTPTVTPTGVGASPTPTVTPTGVGASPTPTGTPTATPTPTPSATPTPGTGSVAGIVFDDLDGDGLLGAGEPGLAGALVVLQQNDVTRYAALSQADGSYLMAGVLPGLYQLRELLAPPGYQVTAGQTNVNVTAGVQLTGLNLANRPVSTATPTASPTPSASASATASPTGTATPTCTPSATPTYTPTPTASPSATASPTATETATPTQTPTATPTYTPTDTPSATASPTGTATWTPTATPTATATPTPATGSVSGKVFDDLDRDGALDPGEPGLTGAVIALIKDGAPAYSTTTQADGNYFLADVEPGQYQLRELLAPAGYYDATGPITLYVSPGTHLTGLNLANRRIPTATPTPTETPTPSPTPVHLWLPLLLR